MRVFMVMPDLFGFWAVHSGKSAWCAAVFCGLVIGVGKGEKLAFCIHGNAA